MIHKPALFVASALLCCCGCGGGEDFSAAPAEIANRKPLAEESNDARSEKTKNSPLEEKEAAVTVTEQSATDTRTKPGSVDETNEDKTLSSKSPGATVGKAATDGRESRESFQATVSETSGTSDSVVPKPDERPEAKSPTAVVESEAVTASGKTESQLRKDKETNESTVDAGASLLEKLSVDESKNSKKRPRSTARSNSRNVVRRTGRLAIAAEVWFRLQNQLAKRFYVAATHDGRKIATSSGQRSLGVLSTQIESLSRSLDGTRTKNNVAAVVTEKQEVTTQPVTGLAGDISAIELVQNGDVVLVGTVDGRLIARSSANFQDWDIYAQDLFSFQDQYRPAVKIADEPVSVVRSIRKDLVLTITKGGEAKVWKMSDVVHKPISPLDMTEQQARSPEAPVVFEEPVYSVALPESRVLSLSVSDNRQSCAVVTSSEVITVFNTEDGGVIDTLTAEMLDDTQPVSVLFETSRKSVLVGLADGRIFRKSLSGGEPIRGTGIDGLEVDYEIVFAPDLRDKAGPITAMEFDQDGQLLYIGRLSGSVSRFDLPRKQMMKSDQLHKGPVIEIRSTAVGVFTIGDDRIAKLSDLPQSAGSRKTTHSFTLPKDEALKESLLIETDDPLIKGKFTVRRNFSRDVADTEKMELELQGIRPADPVLALYEHQLRVVSDDIRRDKIRAVIRRMKQENDGISATESVEQESPAATGSRNRVPVMLGEVSSEFDYQSKPLRRAVLSVSDDGKVVAGGQVDSKRFLRGALPNRSVFAWDLIAQTRLRAWRRSGGIMSLDLDVGAGFILPNPLFARLSMTDGSSTAEERKLSTSKTSPYKGNVAVGYTGMPSVAGDALGVISRGASKRRNGVEAFEVYVPAIAWSHDGESIFASLREASRLRLLELDGRTLEVKSELANEMVSGVWNVDKVEPDRDILGTTHILPAPGNRMLLTYGHYAEKMLLISFESGNAVGAAGQRSRWLRLIPGNPCSTQKELTHPCNSSINRRGRLRPLVQEEWQSLICEPATCPTRWRFLR